MALFSSGKDIIKRPKCSACGLFREVNNPRFKPQGKGGKGILFITPSPSGQQDKSGSLYEGEATHYFASQLEKRGINLKRDCWILPATGCFTNRKSEAVKKRNQTQCKPRYEGYIKQLNPKIIIALGGPSLNAMAKGIYYKPNIKTYEGRVLPDYTRNCWLGSLPHPLHLVRGDDHGNCLKDDKYYMTYYDRMINNVLRYVNKEMPPYHDIDSKIESIIDYRDVISLLDSIIENKPKALSFDYETNSATSFVEGVIMETASLAWNRDRGFSFPVDRAGCFTKEQQDNIKRRLRIILMDDDIGKVAHAIMLEDNWSIEYLGVDKINWLFDTQVGAHMLDVTEKTKGLKHHLSIRYGITDYGSEIHPFLVSEVNEFNKIHKVKTRDLLHYNGIDALGGFWLYQDMWKELGLDRKRSRRKLITDLYMEGCKSLCKVYRKGIPLDLDFFEKESILLRQEEAEALHKVRNSREGKLFKEREGHDLDISNSNQLGKLLYDYLKIEPPFRTATGKGSTDKAALSAIDLPFLKDVSEAKKLYTLRNTFVEKMPRMAVNGIIHPEYSICHTVTGRSNCFAPNLQQIPKRWPRGKQIRKGFVAPEGYYIGCFDYSSVEISTNACCSNDEDLKFYIRTPGTDMHGDSAEIFFGLPPEEITKEMRQNQKSNWNFLLFYGGFPSSAAKRIYETWDDTLTSSGISLHDHMRIRGINTLYELKAHAEEEAEKLWKRFPTFKKYRDWKDEEYFTKGYVTTALGFRRNGYVTRNMTVNAPAQGTGFQWLLDSLIATDKWFEDNNMKSYVLGQIHDDLMICIHHSELQEVINGVIWNMTTRLENKYDHIDIPLKTDPEISDLSGSWYSCREWGKGDNGIWGPKR